MRLPFFLWIAAAAAAAPVASEWVYFGSGHRLEYRADAHGNRIMDFSYAGYRAGGVRLPSVATAKTLAPAPGDSTARIQQALDAVGQSAPGAVLLGPGTYELAGTLSISTSGVVLRGSGSGAGGTVIKLTGDPHRFLQIRGTGKWEAAGRHVDVTDPYVPSGAQSFHVKEPAAFRAGDTILVDHPVTAAWIHFMGMDTLVRDGKAQTWIKAGTSIRTDRVIQAIDGNQITLDAPLSDSLDSAYFDPPGATIVKYSFPGRISEVGVESLRVEAPSLDVPITSGQFTVLQMDAVIDGWARDIDVQETQNGVTIGPAAKRITLERGPHSPCAAAQRSRRSRRFLALGHAGSARPMRCGWRRHLARSDAGDRHRTHRGAELQRRRRTPASRRINAGRPGFWWTDSNCRIRWRARPESPSPIARRRARDMVGMLAGQWRGM